MLDIGELRTLLKFEGIDLTNYTDDELTILVNSKSYELSGLIGLDIEPKHRSQRVTDFKGNTLRLEFYPVYDLASIKYNHCPLKHCDYHLDRDLGIIHFDDYLHGTIEVKYLSGLSDDTMNALINPLLKDMVAYTLTYNKLGSPEGVSSIKEGDVSVNYDTSNSRGSRIANSINDIKSRYASARLRWL